MPRCFDRLSVMGAPLELVEEKRFNLIRMTWQEFRQSQRREDPPGHLSFALAGLWWDAKGNWKRAHENACFISPH